MTRQIILDTETTGLSTEQGHRLIEVGCLEMVNRELTSNHFHHYIQPDREIDPGAQRVHGISNEFLADKPRFGEIAADLWAYLDGAELIIHNAPFDLGFLNYEFALWKKSTPKIEQRCKIIDTLVMARSQHPGQKNNLDVLCSRYHVDNSNRELHGALKDAELLADVYLMMTGKHQQRQLFGDVSPQKKVKATVKSTTAAVQAEGLVVVKPNAEELARHEAFVADCLKDG